MIDGISDMIAGTVVVADGAHRPTVSSTYLRAVVEFAATRGIVRRALLLHAGLNEADLAGDEMRHPIDRLITLLNAGAALGADPAFALHFGAHVPCEQVSLAAPLGRTATTVIEALQQVNRYARLSIDFPLLGSGDRYRLQSDAAGVWLDDLRPADAWPEITELVFARMAGGTRRVAGDDVLHAVYVTHAAPAHREAYDAIFRVPIHFRSTRNALLLAPGYLSTVLVPAPTHVTRILAAHADAQLTMLDQQRSCRGRLEAALRPMLHTGDLGVERIARSLAMSRQTLYRKLKAEGVTYEHVLESLRRAVAVEWLQSGKSSVREVAARVGFSDPAAFSRAFKRWTGRSPSRLGREAAQISVSVTEPYVATQLATDATRVATQRPSDDRHLLTGAPFLGLRGVDVIDTTGETA